MRTPSKPPLLTLGLALLVRLILMPITLHPDLLAIEYYPSLLWSQGIWDFYGSWVGKINLEHLGILFYPPLAYYLVALLQVISGAALSPSFTRILDAYHVSFVQNPRMDAVDFFALFSLSDRLWFTFWSKWVFFLVDVFAFVAFTLFFKDTETRRLQFQKAWLWSPVLLFST